MFAYLTMHVPAFPLPWSARRIARRLARVSSQAVPAADVAARPSTGRVNCVVSTDERGRVLTGLRSGVPHLIALAAHLLVTQVETGRWPADCRCDLLEAQAVLDGVTALGPVPADTTRLADRITALRAAIS